jgi:pantetheine-phosphate adenylyltransferase
MLKAIYPGSFDPITLGHVDVVERAITVFDELVLLVAENGRKQYMFTLQERLQFAKETFHSIPHVRVDSFQGLLVEYMQKKQIRVCVRGLRVLSDFEYEMRMAITNKQLWSDYEVFYLMSDIKFANFSSSLVREILHFRGHINDFVPDPVVHYLKKQQEEDNV